MTKDRPVTLFTKLYREPAFIGLARLVGYEGVERTALDTILAVAVVAPGGTATVGDAVREMLVTGEDGVARLNEEARRCCRIILGPPPESPEYGEYQARNGGVVKQNLPKEPVPPAPARKPRNKSKQPPKPPQPKRKGQRVEKVRPRSNGGRVT